jgi:hypothetical protein
MPGALISRSCKLHLLELLEPLLMVMVIRTQVLFYFHDGLVLLVTCLQLGITIACPEEAMPVQNMHR